MASRSVPRGLRWTALTAALLLARAGLSLAGEPGAKLAVPGEAEQQRALALVREVYGQEYEDAKTPGE